MLDFPELKFGFSSMLGIGAMYFFLVPFCSSNSNPVVLGQFLPLLSNLEWPKLQCLSSMYSGYRLGIAIAFI